MLRRVFPGGPRRAGLLAVAGAVLVVASCSAHDSPAPRSRPPVTARSHASGTVGRDTVPTSTPTTPLATRPATPAPATVTRSFTLVDPSRPTVSHGTTIASSRTLPITVWFPAGADGAIAGHRLPWIVFLHGYLAEPQRYAPMLEAWARAGYAVVAPTFPLTSSSSGAVADEADMVNEPADVSFVISTLLAHPSPVDATIGDRLDPGRIAIGGHSDGANVAFAVGYSSALGDPRVHAVIDLSGELPTGMGPYSGNGPPLLLIHPDHDEFVPHEQTAAMFDTVTVPRWWVELHGVSHEPAFVGAEPWADVVAAITIDFLDRTVGGHRVPAATIDAAASRPGVASLEARAGVTD